MVACLLNGFCRDGGKLTVAAVDQPLVERHVPRIHQILTGNGVSEAAVWLFHQQQIAELTLIAAIGQGVFIALTLPFSGVGQEITRLPEQIKADIGERQVNFQLRRVAAPGAQTL